MFLSDTGSSRKELLLLVATWTVIHLSVGCADRTAGVSGEFARAEIEFLCSIDGKQLQYHLTGEQIEKQMNWHKYYANPPLSVRDAIRMANEQLSEFKARKIVTSQGDWELDSANLKFVDDDHSYYIVVFDNTICDSQISVVVLMDGTTVMPKSFEEIDEHFSSN